MKKRVIISTVVSFVLLLAVIAAGINAVFTVNSVSATFGVFSGEGHAEAETTRLALDRYLGKSSLFLDLADVESLVAENPYFRLESIEKKFPSTISLTVSERRETYAAQSENGYSLIDERGEYLCEKEDYTCRLGGKAVLLCGFSLTFSPRERASGEYSDELFAALEALNTALGEIRANVISVTLVRQGSDPRNDFFYVQMREGVLLQLKNPSALAREKAAAAVKTYLELADAERVFGAVAAVDGLEDGEVSVSYLREDFS